MLDQNKKYGPLPAKGYPARAAILINFLNLNKNNISAIFEREFSKKIKHYVPGTKIPIVSDKFMKKKIKPKIPILNLAWHIKNEIKQFLNNKKIENRIINIIDNKDFFKL